MKKIININFHGRVIPIEETAYDILKQYIEGLRKHFANEEGRDEIINDIENRFAELFSERLQKGSTCITDEDVNSIIVSMGRPEDFEEDEMTSSTASANTGDRYSSSQSSSSSSSKQSYTAEEPHRLYRSENDKILGGVCGGLAAYLRIDPAIVRIIFALITFGGFGSGFLLYIILWIVVPSKSVTINIRKRLYRNPENKMIGGVASGLAAYFHIEVWIPRLIFLLPLIAGIIASMIRHNWFDFDPGPVFVTGGFGGTLFITYIILWIVLPEAVTASEKLEMRGEKVDLESIKNTIKSDLEGFKGRAGQMGAEVGERAKQFGQEVRSTARSFASEAGPAVRRTGTGIGHAIGVLFKAFFLFIAGMVAFALVMVLIGLLFSGAGTFPFRNYLLSGFWQNFLAWASLVLFLCIPIIALLTWLIRRIMGARSRSNYLGYAFGSLWVVGLICFIIFVSMIISNFRSRASVDDDVTINQPARKLVVRVAEDKTSYYGSDWFGFNWDDNDAPFYSVSEDSVMMNTVRVSLVKSKDGEYHVHRVKFSHGNNPQVAKDLANQIQFNITQTDSIMYLPQGFAITPGQKFRNQQVLVIVEVPIGKRIVVDRSVNDYHWFNINVTRRHRGWNVDWNDDWDDSYPWDSNVEYIMTEHGLERANKSPDDDGDNNDQKTEPSDGYRYKKKTDSTKQKPAKDSVKVRSAEEQVKPDEEKIQASFIQKQDAIEQVKKYESQSSDERRADLLSPFYILTKLI